MKLLSLRSAVDIPFLGITALSWLCFFALVEFYPDVAPEHGVLFALGAGVLSFWMLKLAGYFEPHRLLPRKSDPFVLLAAIVSSGVIQLKLMRIFLDVSVCSTRTVLIWAPIISGTIYVLHYAISLLLLKRGKQRKVVLDVSPEEREAILEIFQELEMSRYLKFLTRQELKEHFLRAATHEISLIVMSRSSGAKFANDSVLISAHLAGIPTVDSRALISDLSGRVSLAHTEIWDYLLGATPQTTAIRAFWHLKSLVEPLLAAFLLVILSPIMAGIAIAIRYGSPGPVLFKQLRTGYLGRNFTLYKFRSMRSDAEAAGPQWASRHDDRVTPLGKVLRATRLDELPQLFNVIRGEMSFFGPRPERPEIYQALRKQIPLFTMRLVVRPGITGWAQVFAGYAASVEESAIKLEYDLYYIQNMSPRIDLIILLKTLAVVLTGNERKKAARAVAEPVPMSSDTAAVPHDSALQA